MQISQINIGTGKHAPYIEVTETLPCFGGHLPRGRRKVGYQLAVTPLTTFLEDTGQSLMIIIQFVKVHFVIHHHIPPFFPKKKSIDFCQW